MCMSQWAGREKTIGVRERGEREGERDGERESGGFHIEILQRSMPFGCK